MDWAVTSRLKESVVVEPDGEDLGHEVSPSSAMSESSKNKAVERKVAHRFDRTGV